MANAINEFALVDNSTKSPIKLNEVITFYCFFIKVITYI